MKSRKIITLICFVVIAFSGCSSLGGNKTKPKSIITKKVTTITVDDVQPIVETTILSKDTLANKTESSTVITNTETTTTTTKSTISLDIVTKPETTTTIQTSTPEITTSTFESSIEEHQYTNEGISKLPESIMSVVQYWQGIYPQMNIGVGIYSLDGKSGYEYNANTPINGACTIKAAYAHYVLEECEKQNIDIWAEENYMVFKARHNDPDGSGNIKYTAYGTQYSIGYLINLLLGVSDNVAFNMLEDRFPISSFYQYNTSIGGECDWLKWGRATVQQRKNEWIAIYNYINSGSKYSEILREDLTGTGFCYIAEGMYNWHNYLHKSGWTDENPDYPASGDCAIIDNEYLIIVMTEDWSAGTGRIDAIRGIAAATESYYYDNGGIF